LIPKSTFYASQKRDHSDYKRQLLISQKNKDLHHLTIHKARIADRYQPQASLESLQEEITIQDEEKGSASRDDLVVVTGEDAPQRQKQPTR
jgi:hypothetical protein